MSDGRDESGRQADASVAATKNVHLNNVKGVTVPSNAPRLSCAARVCGRGEMMS